ncbi:MAG: N-acetylmuramoyl-L-alanine amidase [Magnetococcales bacterium]|nr:N-acetylmuramoyl-L-alanine amidase [Magnetococcales bacterium]
MIIQNTVLDKKDVEKMSPMQRRKVLKGIILSMGSFILPPSFAQAARLNRITDVRMWTAPDHTRIVFDLERNTRHQLIQLRNPSRLVVDLMDTVAGVDPADIGLSDPIVNRVRSGIPRPGIIRTVFELKTSIKPRAFALKASSGKPPRLVLDLVRSKGQSKTVSKHPVLHQKTPRRDAVIVIDPGHGGIDPGAVGPRGTKEKDVALQVAKRLAEKINEMDGFKAELTRKGDYFVSLRKRVSVARKHQADLFVSLHANAFKLQSARGASVYMLSEGGKPSPDKAIRRLVQRENSADLIGGVNLNHVSDPTVRGILMDLTQRDSLNRALVYGKNLLGELKSVPSVNIHFKEVKQAGFAVLKAPDMPSILVEMAFLTNRREEKMLRNNSHQDALADALASGTKKFINATGLA